MCQRWCSCVHMVRCWCVDVYTHGTWGGVGCVNVGVHVYTWYAAGVLMCIHMVRGVGWGVSTLVFMCTHGTLLVC